jgi:hypothetical protein
LWKNQKKQASLHPCPVENVIECTFLVVKEKEASIGVLKIHENVVE